MEPNTLVAALLERDRASIKKIELRTRSKTRKAQLLRTAYLPAARAEADVKNHLARRFVAANGKI
jgi:hypothetical protein